jgi:hypothetical protein
MEITAIAGVNFITAIMPALKRLKKLHFKILPYKSELDKFHQDKF